MPLSAVEKVQVVTDLGWPGLTVEPNSIHFVNWVNDRLSTITAPMETLLRQYIKRLQDMDAKLEKAVCRASVSSVDGVTFNKDEIHILRKERYRILKEVSQLLDIPIMGSGSMGNVCV